MAIEKCEGLMALKQAGKTWDGGLREYLDGDVFAVSLSATLANNQVWRQRCHPLTPNETGCRSY